MADRFRRATPGLPPRPADRDEWESPSPFAPTFVARPGSGPEPFASYETVPPPIGSTEGYDAQHFSHEIWEASHLGHAVSGNRPADMAGVRGPFVYAAHDPSLLGMGPGVALSATSSQRARQAGTGLNVDSALASSSPVFSVQPPSQFAGLGWTAQSGANNVNDVALPIHAPFPMAASGLIRSQRAHRKHTTKEEANYQCTVQGCGKFFSRSYNYKSHLETHDEQREYPFPCLIGGCNKRFVRKTDLQRHHQSVHVKERHHRCDFCGRLFARKDTLRRHREDGCSKRFDLKTLDLRSDIRATTAPTASGDQQGATDFNDKTIAWTTHHSQPPG